MSMGEECTNVSLLDHADVIGPIPNAQGGVACGLH